MFVRITFKWDLEQNAANRGEHLPINPVSQPCSSPVTFIPLLSPTQFPIPHHKTVISVPWILTTQSSVGCLRGGGYFLLERLSTNPSPLVNRQCYYY